MQVEELTAQLGLTGLAQFLSGLKSADTQIDQTKRKLDELTVSAVAARAALGNLKVDTGAIEKFTAQVTAMKKELSGLDTQATTSKSSVRDVKMVASQGAETVAVAEVEKRALKSLEDQAVKTAAAVQAAGATTFLASSGQAFMHQDTGTAQRLNEAKAMRAADEAALQAFVNQQGGTGVTARENALRSERAMASNASEFARLEAQRQAALNTVALSNQVRSERAMASNAAALAGIENLRGIRADVLPEDMATLQRLEQQMGVGPGAERANQLRSERAMSANAAQFARLDAQKQEIERQAAIVNNTRSERAMVSNAAELLRVREQQSLRALIPNQDMRLAAMATQIPREDLRYEERKLAEQVRASRGVFGLSGGGGGGGSSGPGAGALFGLLPGGARGTQAAVTSLIGLGLSAAVGAGPGVAGLGIAAAAGATTLVGALGTLKLAFADITAAAFTQQKAFNALTPTQQAFVQSLRSLDAGLVKGLEHTAANTLLPQLTSALHQAFTPSSAAALQGGVGAIANSIGGGVQQFAKQFGSAGFSQQFGTMLKQDAGYLRQFLDGITHLTDAFVRLNVAGGPFLSWLGKATTDMTKWVDQSIRADQVNGRLTHFFDMAKASLQTLGGLFASVGHLASGFAAAVGFQNALNLINLIRDAINNISALLQKNKHSLNDFFAGALGSAKDMLQTITALAQAITPLLTALNGIARALGGWRAVLDTLTVLWIAKFLLMKTSTAQLGTEVAAVAGTQGIAGLIASLGTLGAIGAAGITIAILYELIKKPSTMDQIANALGGPSNPNASITSPAIYMGSGFVGTVNARDAKRIGIPVGTVYSKPSPGIVGPFPDGMFYTVSRDGTLGNTPVTPFNGMQVQNPKDGSVYTYTGNNVNPNTNPNVAGPRTGPPTSVSGVSSTPVGQHSIFKPHIPFIPTSRATVLPTNLENAIKLAQYQGDVGAERTAINAGLAWISAHVGAIKDQTTKGLYYDEGTALKSQLASLASAQTTAGNKAYSAHIANISAGLSGRQASLSAARTALSGATSGTPGQEIAAAGHALTFAHTQMDELVALKEKLANEKQTSRMKVEEARVQREINYTNALISQAHKDDLAAVKRVVAEHEKAVRAAVSLQLTEHATRLSSIGQTFRADSGSSFTGEQNLAAARKAIQQAGSQWAELVALQNKLKDASHQTAASKREEERVTKEILTAQRLVSEATKEQAKAVQQIKNSKIESHVERILGIAGNETTGVVAAARMTQQVRHFLTQQLTGHGMAAGGSLQEGAQALYKAGDINKKQYESLEKILKSIDAIRGDTGHINSGITGNVSQRLQQIKDALTKSQGFSNLDSVTTEQQRLHDSGARIVGTRAQRARLMEMDNEAIQNHNRIHRGAGSIFGVPLNPDGTPAIKHPGLNLPGTVGGSGFMGGSEVFTPADRAAQRNFHPSFKSMEPLSVTINVHGVHDPKAVANEVYSIFQKQRHRNTTPLTGANAGRNLGAGLG